MAAHYTVGIEEEYFLVDAATKSVAARRPGGLFCGRQEGPRRAGQGRNAAVADRGGDVAAHDMATARAELKHLRQTVATVAAEHGLAILAAGTHPTADWGSRSQSPAERYDAVMHDLQMIGQRNMLCGLHVHVELPDPEDRVDVMYRMLPYLPLFIALATSSPFWQSRPTGLKGYRLAAYDELPRTGVPELFRRREEFDAYIAALTRAGVIEDSSYVWWAMRPSLKHADAGAARARLLHASSTTRSRSRRSIAALARRLCRNPWLNWDMTAVTPRDRGREQVAGAALRRPRHLRRRKRRRCGHRGRNARAGARGSDAATPRRSAASTRCERCRTIVGVGTSADAQLAVFAEHEKKENRERALDAVTDWLAAATLQ